MQFVIIDRLPLVEMDFAGTQADKPKDKGINDDLQALTSER